jgi:hypothetical protein
MSSYLSGSSVNFVRFRGLGHFLCQAEFGNITPVCVQSQGQGRSGSACVLAGLAPAKIDHRQPKTDNQR